LATSGEYSSYVSSFTAALAAIKKGMAGGFLQTGLGARLRQAVLSDSSLTEYDRQAAMSFLSSGAGNGYVPKSGEITNILGQLKADFEKSLAEVTSAEAEAVKVHEDMMSAKKKQVMCVGGAIETEEGANWAVLKATEPTIWEHRQT
jgi:hypothetical protein